METTHDTVVEKRHALELIERLQPAQVGPAVRFLEFLLSGPPIPDRFSRKLALARIDDEPFTEEDRQAVAEADNWRKVNLPIPLENVLADFGLTTADWDAIARAPLIEETGSGNEHG